MEGVELHEDALPINQEDEDICDSILSRFGTSTKELHQHLCAVVGAISAELKESTKQTSISVIYYFGATTSSLTKLSEESNPSEHIITALLTFLSMVLPRVSKAILGKKRSEVSGPILKVLGRKGGESGDVGSVISGLKCLGYLVVVGDKGNWSEIEKLYDVVLGFISDHREKVRKQCHTCLHDVLQSFKGTGMLAPACEGITRIFERNLLFACKSNAASTSDGGSGGAQAVLYIIHCLKNCLPLMAKKNITSVLNHYKSLLDLDQPIVNRLITDNLNALCIHPTSEVSPEVLGDLLGSLANAVHKGNRTADSMTFTGRLLDVGMRKVYPLDRQGCVVKLPDVFRALAEILACEHEEAIFAAAEALKSLIHACIDEILIKQGVNQIVLNSDEETRKSGKTIIERICVIIESLLGYKYNDVLDLAFQVVSAMFDKIGNHSSYLLRGTLRSLANIQDRTDEDLAYRKQLHKCIGSALGALGPETFLSILPLNLESEDVSESGDWLFPILKHYTVGASLSFFTKSILDKVKFVKKKSQRLEQEGRIYLSRRAEALVYSLWSLFPAFCNYPVDTANSFKVLEEALCRALREEPDVLGIICSGLQILIQQNNKMVKGNNDLPTNELSIPEKRAVALYTPEVAKANLKALRSSAREFLSVLSSIFLSGADVEHLRAEVERLKKTMPENTTTIEDLEKKLKEAEASKDCGGSLQSTISEFASIADKKDIQWSFTRTMKRLLKVTKESLESEKSKKSSSMEVDPVNELSPKAARAQLLDLAVSHLPGLDPEAVKLLNTSIRPALEDSEGLLQKKAYKILSIILKHRNEFLSENIDDLLQLLLEVLPSCHFSAKRHRLQCLYFLIVHVSKNGSEQRRSGIISSFLTEIILAVKESNKKTRNMAYDLLVQIGHACGDEDQGGNKENLQQLFNMVAGGLAGETPQMISAAVKGLARLAYEFSYLVSSACNVLPSSFLLLQRKNREIIKANLGLLKVLVARSPAEWLQTHLRSVVEGLLRWQDDSKKHFKAKVKLLLEMLVKKCGLDAVKAVMPEEHIKLLKNIKKLNDRKDRKDDAASMESKSVRSKATTSRLSKWNHTKIFSDFGDDSEDNSDMEAETVTSRRTASQFNTKASAARSKQTRRSAKRSLPEDFIDQFEDDPLDLLDQLKTRSALRSNESSKRQQDSDDEVEIEDGKLVIREGGRPKRDAPSEPDTDSRSRASGSRMSSKSSNDQKKRRKTSESGWAYTGQEYASKKAGGDLKKKDKLEPYAYWPLDRKMMSRRPEHRAAARKGMASVVRMTKKLEGKSASALLSSNGGAEFKRKQNKSGSSSSSRRKRR
ncbi:RRP12-like protein [Papaver somniferum]|uniref:RRP12-like protein n=1 Tax=Papaver somniferum TaxID=3469 RepID=UPI000E6FA0AB|nr:RRP12-like protein [Papaver somniferum]